LWTTAQQRQLSPAGIVATTPYMVELADLLNEICRAFGYHTPEGFSVEDKWRTVMGLLKQRRCLVIVDNFETLSQAEQISNFLRKTPHPTKTLVTSRKLVQIGEGERLVRLPPLTLTEALAVIENQSQVTGVSLSEGQSQQLFELCSGIPAALTWSIGKMTFSSPDIVLRDLANLSNVEDLIEFCFQSALDALNIRHHEAANVFLMLALFPFPIGTEALREVAQLDDADLFDRIVKELSILSLIRLDDKVITTLPLVRQYAKHRLGGEISVDQHDVRRRLAQHVSRLSQSGLIHVFTPINELVALPKDATAVDFAYSIHPDLGNKFLSATVNGLGVAPADALKDGDQVAIVAGPASQGPSLEMARTELAKRRIMNRGKRFARLLEPVRRGNTYSRDGSMSESLREYDSAVSLDPEHIWAHNRRGQVLRLLGDVDGALTAFDTALMLAPNDPFAHC
jgi:tetratricopeptide (TPR) repeat protein